MVWWYPGQDCSPRQSAQRLERDRCPCMPAPYQECALVAPGPGPHLRDCGPRKPTMTPWWDPRKVQAGEQSWDGDSRECKTEEPLGWKDGDRAVAAGGGRAGGSEARAHPVSTTCRCFHLTHPGPRTKPEMIPLPVTWSPIRCGPPAQAQDHSPSRDNMGSIPGQENRGLESFVKSLKPLTSMAERGVQNSTDSQSLEGQLGPRIQGEAWAPWTPPPGPCPACPALSVTPRRSLAPER